MAESDTDDLISIIEEHRLDIPIPDSLPFMPVRDVVVFSDMVLPLFVTREKSIRSLDDAVDKEGIIFLATQKNPETDHPETSDIYHTGTVGKILRVLKLPDGRAKTLIQGIAKGRIIKFLRKRTSYRVRIEVIHEEPVKETDLETEAVIRTVRENSKKILALRGELNNEVNTILDNMENPGKLADLVASNLGLKIEESQSLLEMDDPIERIREVNHLLTREVDISLMQAKIQSDVKNEMTRNQRNYFLKEQVRAIHKELGEQDDLSKEIKDYHHKIKQAAMSKEAQKEALKQLDRLERMHHDSSESAVVRNYLDRLVEMPWSKSTKDYLNIKNAKKILDKNHYGLDKVKDRILEYLSVRKLNPKSKGPILCFIGPPGVGKTSLGQAVASAMKRKFVRISLGGIRDEAELRGHRRTYVGAFPGRILQGLEQCQTNNPVFMMDEIDKIGVDFRGDPSSVLLEALDPEQNFKFSDHYLNLPFDLSGVMFILTANMTDTIPPALLDRMEIIHLSGYTEEEKYVIAKKFLIPRQVKENGLTNNDIQISAGALKQIISEYTLEAGLRNLEREIGTLCRKTARKIAQGEKGLFSIKKSDLQSYLGVSKYYPEMDQADSRIGLSTGLAWTQYGGEVLYVEVSLIKGKGDLIITGQIGDVMQESARAALTYSKAKAPDLNMDEDMFENLDIHIHVPAGATPKDGPSAGAAIAVALISALTKKPVNKDVAMTGEISLTGRILPVGGLREKAVGALRAGIKTVVIPDKNKREISEIPPGIKGKIKFIPVKSIDDILPVSILDDRLNKA